MVQMSIRLVALHNRTIEIRIDAKPGIASCESCQSGGFFSVYVQVLCERETARAMSAIRIFRLNP